MLESRPRFQGQYHDVETGLHYNFARYYDPRTNIKNFWYYRAVCVFIKTCT
ncbi:RHS repeat-associated core domain-containing protein [Vibrio vulnificus]|uniref:RHS repeat-associated core domain-containing protein n=1 Tax=Vibrio vulnificus TaxID=672 RepID=UPI00405977FA